MPKKARVENLSKILLGDVVVLVQSDSLKMHFGFPPKKYSDKWDSNSDF